MSITVASFRPAQTTRAFVVIYALTIVSCDLVNLSVCPELPQVFSMI